MTEPEETIDLPGPRPKRWGWRPKLRWFAAEIVVVVAGVLIALALNAWWGARQAEAKETVYLRQRATQEGRSSADSARRF